MRSEYQPPTSAPTHTLSRSSSALNRGRARSASPVCVSATEHQLPIRYLPQRKLLFIGDSVTCGVGIDNWPVCPTEPNRYSNGYDAYGMVLGRRLEARAGLVGYGGRGVVRDYLGHPNVLNAPQFFNYSIPADDPAGQAKWIDDGWTPDAVVISLGTNDWNLQNTDALTEDEFVSKYLGLVPEVRTHYLHDWIALTQAQSSLTSCSANG